MSWQCETCSETHDDSFDSCWQCGTYCDPKDDGLEDLPLAFHSVAEPKPKPRVPGIPCSTTSEIPNREIESLLGIVYGEAILGANILRDLAASLTDLVGGRSGAYESKLKQGREIAVAEMVEHATQLGANAVIGVHIDIKAFGESMIMVNMVGTAVKLKDFHGG